ncbi:MAG: hypothetical protein DRQ78_11645 [Epsilonproteobacteria bacterium]|nr:MAG: hypothetical protein DRQ78_11645 [Campylobacterota bacterium]
MKLKAFVLYILLMLLLSACAKQPYLKEHTALILFKTENFKYADLGFIYENKEEVKVEIYASGQALMTLSIGENAVCMSALQCMSKAQFNKEVLSATYPQEIISDIFRGKAIFSGLNIRKNGNGFTQNIIKQDKYHIEYSVLNKHIIFRDKMNDILIKVTRQ